MCNWCAGLTDCCVVSRVKLNFFLANQAGVCGSGRKCALILNFGNRCGVMLVSYPGRFTPRKELQRLLNRRLGGPQSPYRRFEKKSTTCPGQESNHYSPARPAFSLVTIPTTLTRFLLLRCPYQLISKDVSQLLINFAIINFTVF